MNPWFRDLPLNSSRTETRAAEQIVFEAYTLPADVIALAQDSGSDITTVNLAAPNQRYSCAI